MNASPQIQVVHVVAAIEPGQEFGATYVEPFGSRTARRKRLQDRFGFQCSCPACSFEGNRLKVGHPCKKCRYGYVLPHCLAPSSSKRATKLASLSSTSMSLHFRSKQPDSWMQESEEIRGRLAALDAEIRSQASGEKALKDVGSSNLHAGYEEFLSLMDEEGFANPYFSGRLCQAVLEGQLPAYDPECAQHFAQLALQNFVTCEGEEGDRTLELKAWLSKEKE